MRLTNLARVLRGAGLRVVEVDGWRSRGREMSGVRTITCHHTATPRSYRPGVDYPTMGVVRDGRPGLPGPLAQLGLGRNGTWYVIASGRANHAGVSLEARYTNTWALGIEAEGAMEPWPKTQYDSYVRGVAALQKAFPGSVVRGHKETASPRGRKIDPSFDMAAFRRAVAAVDTTQAATPTPKGLLESMSNHVTVLHTKDQTIPARSSVRVRVMSDGKHQLAPAIQGRTYAGSVGAAIRSVRAKQQIRARVVVAVYKAGKLDRIVTSEDLPQVTFPADTGGWSWVRLPLAEICKAHIPAGSRGEYQLQIENHSDSPVTVVRAGGSTLYT